MADPTIEELEWASAVNKALLESQERLVARVAELERELDEEREKVGLLMQPRPDCPDGFPWEMMRLWCANYKTEKLAHRERVAELERENALLRGRLPCEHPARKSHGRHEWYVDVAGSGDGYCRACGAIGAALAGRGDDK